MHIVYYTRRFLNNYIKKYIFFLYYQNSLYKIKLRNKIKIKDEQKQIITVDTSLLDQLVNYKYEMFSLYLTDNTDK